MIEDILKYVQILDGIRSIREEINDELEVANDIRATKLAKMRDHLIHEGETLYVQIVKHEEFT